MATSKTLTPTNVVIQIPEFTDKPDQRVNSNCIDKLADAVNTVNSKITTLDSYPKTYYLGFLVSSATLADQVKAAFLNHKSEAGIRFTFNITSPSPSDLPGTGNEWKYACGEVKIRTIDANGSTADGMVILYGFNANKIAIRTFANNVFANSWTVLGS